MELLVHPCRSVNADPFNSSPLCHGYAGLLAYIFWCKETNLDSKTEFELRSNNDDGTNSVVSGLSDVYPKASYVNVVTGDISATRGVSQFTICTVIIIFSGLQNYSTGCCLSLCNYCLVQILNCTYCQWFRIIEESCIPCSGLFLGIKLS